jgi:hypothetical protein
MTEIDRQSSDPFERLYQEHALAIDYLTDLTVLAAAYMDAGLGRLDERIWGKLELVPKGADSLFHRSIFRLEQYRIISALGSYLVNRNMDNVLAPRLDISPDSQIANEHLKKDRTTLDLEIASIVKRVKSGKIGDVSPETRQRWVFATFALAIFDGFHTQKENDPTFRLEMRKAVLDGLNHKFSAHQQKLATQISAAIDREKLRSLLLEYIDGVAEEV